MRGLMVRSPLLAVLGLVAVGLVAVKLVEGGLTLPQAATRLVVLQVVLLLADRLLLPLARGLAQTGRPQPAPEQPPAAQ